MIHLPLLDDAREVGSLCGLDGRRARGRLWAWARRSGEACATCCAIADSVAVATTIAPLSGDLSRDRLGKLAKVR